MTFAKKPRDFSQRHAQEAERSWRGIRPCWPSFAATAWSWSTGWPSRSRRTKDFAGVLKNLKIDRSCLVAIRDYDENVHKSARNIQRVDVLPVADLNAAAIVNHKQMLFTKDASDVVPGSQRGGSSEESATA